jgi:hypothetical protein
MIANNALFRKECVFIKIMLILASYINTGNRSQMRSYVHSVMTMLLYSVLTVLLHSLCQLFALKTSEMVLLVYSKCRYSDIRYAKGVRWYFWYTVSADIPISDMLRE